MMDENTSLSTIDNCDESGKEAGKAAHYVFSIIFVLTCASFCFFAVKLFYMTLLEAQLTFQYQVAFSQDAANRHMAKYWIAAIGLGILAIVMLVASTKAALKSSPYTLYGVGNSSSDPDAKAKVQLKGFDRSFNEFQILLLAFGAVLAVPALLAIWTWLTSGIWANTFLLDIIGDDPLAKEYLHGVRGTVDYYFYFRGMDELMRLVPMDIILLLGLLLAGLSSVFFLWVIHSWARKIRVHSFAERFLIVKLCVVLYKVLCIVAINLWKAIRFVALNIWKGLCAIGRGLRTLKRSIGDAFYKGGLSLFKMLLLMFAAVLVSWLISLCVGGEWSTSFILMPIVLCVLIVILVPAKFKKYVDIRTGIEHVRSGDFDYKIVTDGRGELGRTAAAVNDIAGANKLAIQKELKTERLKTDLISNVSHDLRTPLTSMISYVDLLKKEGLDSENAPEYLDILEEKTARLKHLTDDLFEAAKASSGDMPVNIEVIDTKSVLTQALAELEEVLEDKNIEMIVNNKAKNTFVKADGRLLWRVMENLITNIGKHALPASRAYADLYNQGDRVVIELKNISADQLNIDSDELMERFKRGDDSRTTEGSGLGLAIARDLTNVMGGAFEIIIDGDLFKARVSFPAI